MESTHIQTMNKLEGIAKYMENAQENALKFWQDFENEVLRENRFLPDSSVIAYILDLFSEKCVYNLSKGKSIYRARKIDEDNVQKCTDAVESTRLLEESCAIKNISSKYDFSHRIISPKSISNADRLLHLDTILWVAKEREYKNIDGELLNKLQQHIFWGFDKTESDAPLMNKSAGRINPIGISYLYAAQDPNTAIAETRPIIRQLVSVAEIEIQNDLRLYDFCRNNSTKDANGDKIKANVIENDLFSIIASRFAKPKHNDDENEYFATQFVSEMLKNMKFDGIRFESTLGTNGQNIVLFDTTKDEADNPKNYTIKNSSIHKINDIKIDAIQVLPVIL